MLTFFNGIWGINSLLFYLIIFLVDLNGMLFLYVEFLAILQKNLTFSCQRYEKWQPLLFVCFFLLSFITNILPHNQLIPDKEGRRTSQKHS